MQWVDANGLLATLESHTPADCWLAIIMALLQTDAMVCEPREEEVCGEGWGGCSRGCPAMQRCA